MSTPSGVKVHYELRSHKQVERRMLIDAFHLLSDGGFAIRNYQYTGFGSWYFVDFILFHKLLGIEKMLSIEHSLSFKKRVQFNKPFENVAIHIGDASEVIPILDARNHHILWLDYDYVIDSEMIEDIRSAANLLSTGSVLLITIDNEAPGPPGDGPERWKQYYEEEAGAFIPADTTTAYFVESELTRVHLRILWRAVMAGVAPRTGVEFTPLFSFLYADGHQMLSVGGMLTTPDDRSRITKSALPKALYYRDSFEAEPYQIKVPNLTRRERLYMDSAMPCPSGWAPADFELHPDEVAAYKEIYRFFPAYAELLL
jgi:hypothetical protein